MPQVDVAGKFGRDGNSHAHGLFSALSPRCECTAQLKLNELLFLYNILQYFTIVYNYCTIIVQSFYNLAIFFGDSVEQSTSFLHPNLLIISKMVPPARRPTRAREMESGVVSDVESPARRRRVTLNLNNQGGGEERADGVPAVAREGEATGIENEVNGVSVNRPDGNGSGNSVNQRVEGASGDASAARMAGAVAPIIYLHVGQCHGGVGQWIHWHRTSSSRGLWLQ